MDLEQILGDVTPEELESRLELQVLIDPLSASVSVNDSNNNNNCKVKGSCIIEVPPSPQ